MFFVDVAFFTIMYMLLCVPLQQYLTVVRSKNSILKIIDTYSVKHQFTL